jgi:putative thioredoxin
MIASLDEKTLENEEIIKVIKLLDNMGGSDLDNIDDIKIKLGNDPENKDIRFELAEKYLAANETKIGFDELLYIFDKDPKWKDELAKKKLLEYFDLLGFNDPNVLEARKKLSSLMFK